MPETEHDPYQPDNVYFFGKPTSSFEPSVFVDVSAYQETRVEALRAHESQVEFLEEHGGIDAEFSGLIEGVNSQASVLGRLAGVEYAEGFTRLHESAVDYLG